MNFFSHPISLPSSWMGLFRAGPAKTPYIKQTGLHSAQAYCGVFSTTFRICLGYKKEAIHEGVRMPGRLAGTNPELGRGF